jgi:precorrin-6Y C5,15-methyltransferase (decarboxylating)
VTPPGSPPDSPPVSRPDSPPVTVVGIHGGHAFGPAATGAVRLADLVVGSRRHLDATDGFRRAGTPTMAIAGPLDAVLDRIAEARTDDRTVCVLASGDPGFFGIVRLLAVRFGPDQLVVHPAPSSVALAFARLGTSWDDATVVSAHGRPLSEAVAAIVAAASSSVAVLTSPASPPEILGRALLDAGEPPCVVTVASHLEEADETIATTDLAGLAAGRYDPMSVVVLRDRRPPTTSGPGLAWGLPETAFEHRDGMITKAEVRAVALGKLALPSRGVLWDLGAGSGSIAVECARMAPGLRVVAVERDGEQADRVRRNAARHRVGVEVVEGEAPEILAGLEDPDRVFVGGGGPAVLDEAWRRLRPEGRVVATYAVVGRALAAADLLGNLTQIMVSRGVPTGQLGLRLQAENPVFVCWGPDA